MVSGAAKLCAMMMGVAIAAIPGGAFAQSATDWSGFYVGVHGAYALGTGEAGSTAGQIHGDTADMDGDGVDDTDVVYEFAVDQTRIDDLFGGLHGGYLVQTGNFVFGGQAALSIGSPGQSRASELYIAGFDMITGDEVGRYVRRDFGGYDIDWLTTFTGRAGIVHDDVLIYVTGGVAWANIVETATVEEYGEGVVVLPESAHITRTSERLALGPVLGFGTQMMIADQISLGAEYNYFKLPDVEVEGITVGTSTTFPGDFHSVKASLNYHF